MTTHRADGPGLPAVVDLGVYRAAHAAPAVTVRQHRSGRWTVVEVAGEMDIQVLPLVADLRHRDATHVVFELRRVTFLDGSGLRMMVDSQRRALDEGGCVRMVAPSRQARRFLMLTGSDRKFVMFDSVEDAVSTPFDAAPSPAS